MVSGAKDLAVRAPKAGQAVLSQSNGNQRMASTTTIAPLIFLRHLDDQPARCLLGGSSPTPHGLEAAP
jgi:hypothetical protein